jgi:hypothetical protein
MSEQWTNETPDRQEHVRVTRAGGLEQRETVIADRAAAMREALVRITQFIWLLFGILEGLIGVRIILKLIAANPGSPFAAFIYNITDLFLWPFFGLTVTPGFNGAVLEISSIIAMLVYALLAWILVKLVWLLLYREPTHTVSTYERDEIR